MVVFLTARAAHIPSFCSAASAVRRTAPAVLRCACTNRFCAHVGHISFTSINDPTCHPTGVLSAVFVLSASFTWSGFARRL